MKKLFGIFSLSVLLFSTFAPAFTYATEVEDEAKQILTETLDETMNEFDESHYVAEVGDSDTTEIEEIVNNNRNIYTSDNPYIVYDEENGLITVYTGDFSYGITIQDKNLGAETAGTGEESYGDYYKWGNNTPYTNSDPSNSIVSNDNAWGGGDDDLTQDNIIEGYNTVMHKATNIDSVNNRQGPCSGGYHVPSAGERSELMKLYYESVNINYTIGNDSTKKWNYTKVNDKNMLFKDAMLLPYAGWRSTDGTFYSEGGYGGYWTSSAKLHSVYTALINDRHYSWVLKINTRQETTPAYRDERQNGLSIRCFKNDYVRKPKTVTYNANGGYFSGGDLTKDYIYNYSGDDLLPIYNIQIPNRKALEGENYSGWMFAGWYTTATDQTVEFDPATSTTNEAYAKWLPFNDLSITMSGVELILMDRNIGAEEIDTGVYSSNLNYDENKIGYYFQWGNIHGFKGDGNNGELLNVNYDGDKKDVDGYGPNNYFYNTDFILNSSSMSWLKTTNRNLWGANSTFDIDRKGPCPIGYHIPKYEEIDKLKQIFETRKSTNEGIEYCNSKNLTNIYHCLKYKLNLPYGGYIGTNGKIYSKGDTMRLWTTNTLSNSDSNAQQFALNASNGINMSVMSSALPIRCFKDEIKEIIYDANGGDLNGDTGITSSWWTNNTIELPIPTKSYGAKEFKGWYTTQNFEEGTLVINNDIKSDTNQITLYAKWECESGTILSEDGQSCNPNIGILNSNDGKGNETVIERYVTNNSFINNGHEFIGWNTQSDGLGTEYISGDVINQSGLVLYAQWKSLEEKTEETTTENVVYTNNTTVTVGDETTEEVLSGSSTLKLVTEEVKEQEVTAEEDKTTVKESEIKVTSDKKVEYEGGLEVYLEKTENVGMANVSTGKVEGTIKFSAPIAVKIPISSEAEYVKVQVKHEGEDFGFKGLTLNPVNECNNGEAVNDKYNGEDVEVKENNGERYATIYTCSASTFVAYTESVKPADPKPSAGGGRVIKQESNATEQEHNSADLEKNNVSTESNKSAVTTTRSNETVEQKIKKVEGKALTRGEVAVMTNILLEVFPQLIEGNKGLDDVTKACTSYADEKDFTKEEKKAITRLCKLSIMGIHAEDKTALEEFMVSKESTNNEFNVVVNRAFENYNEKDLATVKEALKKLENDEQSVVFGTVYDVFMGIKSIFN